MLMLQDVPLAPFTTLKVGGPARYFVEARAVADVSDAVDFARSRDLPLFVLGGGSNLVVSDAGWPGMVLKIALSGINHRHEREHVVFEVAAGEEWDRFVAMSVTRNFSGIECLTGIPGSVGGTPVQNVGAYGQEVAEVIDAVQVLDLNDGQVRELCREACSFNYRTSVFNTTARGRFVILRVDYALKHGGEPRLEYADLKKYFSGWAVRPTLAETREAVRQIRARKAMLITPGDEDCRSAGSFFKNPVLSAAALETLTRLAARKNLQVPSYPALEAQRKISAAWLVEHSGFSRGYTSGHVGISRKHALAIVNRGDATAAEILAFSEQIQHRVEELWDIDLEPEPVFVGFN
ncbi:MAG TPA: UDP-N-acetylmuramate dehydrogenase [Terriglobales bacterium]|jgi:UDP-N-acetylmuramate dehydrogenase|nr:UDP-N-acetylmuramate dehydrogenase [Terriglobales bacterium]